MIKPRDLMTFDTACQVRIAFHERRRFLLSSWLNSYKVWEGVENSSCKWWSDAIQELNDAAIQLGYSE